MSGERFFRAIRLHGAIKRTPLSKIEQTVEHEKAHIEMAEELGYGDTITGYRIYKDAINAAVSSDYSKRKVPEEVLVAISLAPKNNNTADLCGLGFRIMMDYLASRGDLKRLKQRFLRRIRASKYYLKILEIIEKYDPDIRGQVSNFQKTDRFKNIANWKV